MITVTTNEGNYFRTGDVVRIVSTGEAILITTGNAASSFTGTRGIGATAAASAATGTDVVIVGHSSTQAATLPTIMMTQRTSNYQWTYVLCLN